MEYDLKTKARKDRTTHNNGLPSALFQSKFEQTNMSDDAMGDYDDYARGLLVDRTADKIAFEHEMPRGGVNARSGRLQLQYYGHRGTADYEKPEMFLDFGGADEADPRGIRTDPDTNKMRWQEAARMRFINPTPDMDYHITGGGRNQAQVMRDRVKADKMVKDRLNVFSRQLDGRVEGKSAPKHDMPSAVNQTRHTVHIGENMESDINLVRKGTIIAADMISRAEYINSAADGHLGTHQYTTGNRGRISIDTSNRAALVAADNEFGAQTTNSNTKAVGMLMANITKQKKNNVDAMSGDIEYQDADQNKQRRPNVTTKVLKTTIAAIAQDADSADSTHTQMRSNPVPQKAEHLANVTAQDHLLDVMQTHNAEIIYKSVKSGRDMEKIRSLMITDATSPELTDIVMAASKSSAPKERKSMVGQNDEDAVRGDDIVTYQYKTSPALVNASRVDSFAVSLNGQESDDTLIRGTNHQQNNMNIVTATANTMGFSDNTSKDRHARPVGKKYMMRYIIGDRASSSVNDR